MKRLLILALLLLSFALATTAYAATGYPWNDHATPYEFLFGNHIDTHQQSKSTGNSQLNGFFYIKFTGAEEEDLPVAMHIVRSEQKMAARIRNLFCLIPMCLKRF